MKLSWKILVMFERRLFGEEEDGFGSLGGQMEAAATATDSHRRSHRIYCRHVLLSQRSRLLVTMCQWHLTRVMDLILVFSYQNSETRSFINISDNIILSQITKSLSIFSF